MFVYPELNEEGELNDFTKVTVPPHLRFLYQHLLENGFIDGIECSDEGLFKIYSREVLKQIKSGAKGWGKLLPDGIAQEIIDNRMFGCKG